MARNDGVDRTTVRNQPRTESTIAELQPGATVSENGLTISRNDVAGSHDQIEQWAAGLGI